MFINWIKAHNYKNFDDISIELKNKNVLLGKPGSGKTNIIDLIKWMLDSRNSLGPNLVNYDSLKSKRIGEELGVSAELSISLNNVEYIISKSVIAKREPRVKYSVVKQSSSIYRNDNDSSKVYLTDTESRKLLNEIRTDVLRINNTDRLLRLDNVEKYLCETNRQYRIMRIANHVCYYSKRKIQNMIPSQGLDKLTEKRDILISRLAEVDEEINKLKDQIVSDITEKQYEELLFSKDALERSLEHINFEMKDCESESTKRAQQIITYIDSLSIWTSEELKKKKNEIIQEGNSALNSILDDMGFNNEKIKISNLTDNTLDRFGYWQILLYQIAIVLAARKMQVSDDSDALPLLVDLNFRDFGITEKEMIIKYLKNMDDQVILCGYIADKSEICLNEFHKILLNSDSK